MNPKGGNRDHFPQADFWPASVRNQLLQDGHSPGSSVVERCRHPAEVSNSSVIVSAYSFSGLQVGTWKTWVRLGFSHTVEGQRRGSLPETASSMKRHRS
jgi:hypothetical protein